MKPSTSPSSQATGHPFAVSDTWKISHPVDPGLAAARTLATESIAHIYSSTALRARQTAQLLAAPESPSVHSRPSPRWASVSKRNERPCRPRPYGGSPARLDRPPGPGATGRRRRNRTPGRHPHDNGAPADHRRPPRRDRRPRRPRGKPHHHPEPPVRPRRRGLGNSHTRTLSSPSGTAQPGSVRPGHVRPSSDSPPVVLSSDDQAVPNDSVPLFSMTITMVWPPGAGSWPTRSVQPQRQKGHGHGRDPLHDRRPLATQLGGDVLRHDLAVPHRARAPLGLGDVGDIADRVDMVAPVDVQGADDGNLPETSRS